MTSDHLREPIDELLMHAAAIADNGGPIDGHLVILARQRLSDICDRLDIAEEAAA